MQVIEIMVGLGRLELPTSAMSKVPLRLHICAYALENFPYLTVFRKCQKILYSQRLRHCVLRMRFPVVADRGQLIKVIFWMECM